MTHDEAIEILIDLHMETYLTNDYEAINYSIKQLKQCEVYTKPIEMHINSSAPHSTYIIGRIKNKYISQHNAYNVEDCSPIKKEPLSYKDWVIEKGYSSDRIYNLDQIISIGNEYQSYLKDFEK